MTSSSPSQRPVPQEIRLSEEEGTLYIRWQDGHQGVYPFNHLRGACPCATCKGHHREIDLAQVVPKEGVFLVDYQTQGHYALRFLWSDTHETGIYTYQFLRSLCRCEQCRNR